MEYDLVFEGGGAKGVAYVGALQALIDNGHTIGRVAGTSAGAITAALLAAGYTPSEIGGIISEKKDGISVFNTFYDVRSKKDFKINHFKNSFISAFVNKLKWLLIPNCIRYYLAALLFNILIFFKCYRMLYSFIRLGGVYHGATFRTWLVNKIALKTGLYDPTLKELYDRTNNHFTCIASDITSGDILILNHITAPELPVSKAVRMSMSIPVVFECVLWRDEFGLYNGNNISGHEIADGGIISNFPLFLFLGNYSDYMGTRSSNRFIGMLLDNTISISGLPDKDTHYSIFNYIVAVFGKSVLVARLVKILNTMLSSDNVTIVDNTEIICKLPARGVDVLDFAMESYKQRIVVAEAYKAMTSFLQNRTERYDANVYNN